LRLSSFIWLTNLLDSRGVFKVVLPPGFPSFAYMALISFLRAYLRQGTLPACVHKRSLRCSIAAAVG